MNALRGCASCAIESVSKAPGGYTATQLGDYSNNVMRASHTARDMNEEIGTDEQRWSTGILPYIRANPTPVHNECPQLYASVGCVTQ